MLFSNQAVRKLMAKCLLKVAMVDRKWGERLFTCYRNNNNDDNIEYNNINSSTNNNNIDNKINTPSLSYNNILLSQLLISHY